MNQENIVMHHLLMCSSFGKTSHKVHSVIKAIQRPVLCLEVSTNIT